MLPSLLIGASAAIVLLLGGLHLLYTLHGPKLRPRDAGLQLQMQSAYPVISRSMTMWRAWIGFNASHALGAMLFGLLYGHFALWQPAWLFASPFVLGLGATLLAAYAVVGWCCWFRTPLIGIVLALLLYVAGVAASLV